MSNFRDRADIPPVLRLVHNLCHRPALRFGLARDPSSRFRDPRFASFLADANGSYASSDVRGATLRGRKLLRRLFVFSVAAGAAWVLVESAKALSVF